MLHFTHNPQISIPNPPTCQWTKDAYIDEWINYRKDRVLVRTFIEGFPKMLDIPNNSQLMAITRNKAMEINCSSQQMTASIKIRAREHHKQCLNKLRVRIVMLAHNIVKAAHNIVTTAHKPATINPVLHNTKIITFKMVKWSNNCIYHSQITWLVSSSNTMEVMRQFFITTVLKLRMSHLSRYRSRLNVHLLHIMK